MRFLKCFTAVALLFGASLANSAVHRVSEGESIQAAIDAASPGDTILVSPGLYEETADDFFGLRISTDNIRLIARVRRGAGDEGKVRLRPTGDQQTGIYAAPASCGPDVPTGGCDEELNDVYIRGFTVEDFPLNGIQTRFVNGFKIIQNESSNNLNNGIYPTISANGLVKNNVSYGALDTAMWVAASQNVRVIGNELSASVIGLEVNLSLDIKVTHNDIYDNSVGVALLHPNTAGNLPLPEMGNWVVKYNRVYNNNLFPNPAPEGTFQRDLPPGVGILALGVQGHTIANNIVEDNQYVGIGVLGWCSAASQIPGRDCISRPPVIDGIFYDPSVSDNLITRNRVSGNGNGDFVQFYPPGLAILEADITYFSAGPAAGENSANNCFEKSRSRDFTIVSSEANGQLPVDGC